eukprot:5653259-Amphidinium_carterae.1
MKHGGRPLQGSRHDEHQQVQKSLTRSKRTETVHPWSRPETLLPFVLSIYTAGFKTTREECVSSVALTETTPKLHKATMHDMEKTKKTNSVARQNPKHPNNSSWYCSSSRLCPICTKNGTNATRQMANCAKSPYTPKQHDLRWQKSLFTRMCCR